MALRKFPDWATTDIADIGNGDPNKSDPGAAKQAAGWDVEKPPLQYMNWLQNLFGHFIRANNEVKIEASTYEAEAGEIVLLDNSAGSATGKLPASPLAGQWVVFGGVERYSLYAVTIDGNGNDIMIAADQTCNLNMDNALFLFYWDDSNSMWKINIQAIQGRSL